MPRRLALGIGLGGLLYVLWSLRMHQAWETGIFDLGIHVQGTWLIRHGLNSWLTTRGMDLLGDHFTPILYLLAPLSAAPEFLLTVQALALAAGAWPLYRLLRLELEEPAAAELFTWAYLLHPGLWALNLFEFHASALATPLILWALWALRAGQPWPYYLALGLLATCGEAMAVTIACMAVIPWAWGERGRAAATLLCGCLWAPVAAFTMLWMNFGEPSPYGALYGGNLLARLFSLGSLTYLAWLLLPLWGLPLGGGWRLLPAVPVILGNLLTWREGQRSPDHHYMAAILPFLLWAAAWGWQRAGRRPRPAWLLGPLLALSLVLHWSRLPWNLQPLPDLKTIPAQDWVSADNGPGARLSQRVACFLFPNPFQALLWGNQIRALSDGPGDAGHPLLPGQALRALLCRPVDWVALQDTPDASSWPLRRADQRYWRRFLDSGGAGYRRIPSDPHLALWQRNRPRGPAPMMESAPALSPDGKWLAYAADAGGRIPRHSLFDPSPLLWLHVVQVGQGHERSLARAWQPAWSPDGRRLAFVSDDNEDGNAREDVFVLTGDDRTRETTREGQGVPSYPSFAPDGKLWWQWNRHYAGSSLTALGPPAWTENSRPIFAWLDETGQSRVEGLPGAMPTYGGGRLVYASLLGEKWQLRVHGGDWLTGGADHCLEPALSGDGNWLTYTQLDERGRCQVRLLDMRTRQSRLLARGYNPAISRDGAVVAFQDDSWIRVWQRNSQRIWVAPAPEPHVEPAP